VGCPLTDQNIEIVSRWGGMSVAKSGAFFNNQKLLKPVHGHRVISERRDEIVSRWGTMSGATQNEEVYRGTMYGAITNNQKLLKPVHGHRVISERRDEIVSRWGGMYGNRPEH